MTPGTLRWHEVRHTNGLRGLRGSGPGRKEVCWSLERLPTRKPGLQRFPDAQFISDLHSVVIFSCTSKFQGVSRDLNVPGVEDPCRNLMAEIANGNMRKFIGFKMTTPGE